MTVQMPAVAPELRSAFVARIDHVEWRDSGNGTDYTLEGHAAVFDEWSEDLWTWAGTFREKIAPGAFTDVLSRKPDVRLLFNHNENYVLGRTLSGTLELTEDDTGLRVFARVAPTSYAQDLRLVMQRGDVTQMSFAFTVAEDEWREDHDAEIVERTIVRVAELFDASVVTYPAYPQTDATMRELRRAADAGLITPKVDAPAGTPESAAQEGTEPAPADASTVARAETDPAGDQTVAPEGEKPDGAGGEPVAPAATDPAGGARATRARKEAARAHVRSRLSAH